MQFCTGSRLPGIHALCDFGTGCGKPAYFSEKKPLFEVQTATGLLHNTNGGSAITPIGEADLPNPGFGSSAPIGLDAAEKGVKARVFQGGNHWDLHKMLDVTSGSEVHPTHPGSLPLVSSRATFLLILARGNIGGDVYPPIGSMAKL